MGYARLIAAFDAKNLQDLDGRDRPGHDELREPA